MSSQQKVTHIHAVLLQFVGKTLTEVVLEGLDSTVGVRLGACAFLTGGCRLSNFKEHVTFLKSGGGGGGGIKFPSFYPELRFFHCWTDNKTALNLKREAVLEWNHVKAP